MKNRKYKILFTTAAASHVKKISDWYNRQHAGLGNRFKQHLKKSIERIKENPFTPSYRYDKVRFCIPDKFPYAAHYTVDESAKTIVIHAILGFKENPEKWQHE